MGRLVCVSTAGEAILRALKPILIYQDGKHAA